MKLAPLVSLRGLLVGSLALCGTVCGELAGRFQLMTTEVSTVGGKTVSRVFKLDTVTGESWVYVLRESEGELKGRWEIIETDRSVESVAPASEAMPEVRATPSALEIAGTLDSVDAGALAIDLSALEVAEEKLEEGDEPLRPEMVLGVPEQLASYNRTIFWAKLHPKGDWIKGPDGKTRFVDADEVKKLLEETEAKKKKLVGDLQEAGFRPSHFKRN